MTKLCEHPHPFALAGEQPARCDRTADHDGTHHAEANGITLEWHQAEPAAAAPAAADAPDLTELYPFEHDNPPADD